jgi:serralysin
MTGSGNVLIDAIAGIGWLGRGGNNNITYYFNNSLGFHNWTATEKAAYQAALQQFANVANITIQEVFSPVGADMNENWVSNAYMLANFGDFGGYHQYPFNPGPATGYYNFDGRPYFNAAGLTPGGVGFQLLMHEVGHGMGLAHTFDTDMGTGVLPGVVNSSDLGTLSFNQNLYSIMSYNNGPSLSSGSNNYGHAATLMAFDIAAIQYLYGANNNFHSSGDTYTLPDSNGPGTYWTCIWDTGGIDQIVYGGTRNATIDLRAATIDNSPTGGGIPSYANEITAVSRSRGTSSSRTPAAAAATTPSPATTSPTSCPGTAAPI